jgi:voltage-gated potassium channel
MKMTLIFLSSFFKTVFYLSPLLITLIISIAALGLIIGKLEKWTKFDSIYYSFITATTIGYGDFRPTKKLSKLLAVKIGMLGLITTGIIVAVAVNSTTQAIKIILNLT